MTPEQKQSRARWRAYITIAQIWHDTQARTLPWRARVVIEPMRLQSRQYERIAGAIHRRVMRK